MVSQFTLQASTRKGNRRRTSGRRPKPVSRPMYERFTARVAELLGREVPTGEFGADHAGGAGERRSGDHLDRFQNEGLLTEK